jgi:quinoprotein glucose dehydrogenase
LNIPGGPAADPEAGILFVAAVTSCSAGAVSPGGDRDDGIEEGLGVTVADFVSGGGGGLGSLDGLSILKPPYGYLAAIDMNSGEYLWKIPNGDTPDRVLNHPLLAGVEVPNTGQPSHATMLVTRSLLMYGEGRGGLPRFHAVDKLTGETVGTIDIPAQTSTAPMTFLHEGVQYVVLPVAGGGTAGSLAALRLP